MEATCACGHLKQRTRCGACNSKADSNGGIQLVCNQSCTVAQRNASLADALGISKDRQVGTSQAVTWLPGTIQYYAENLIWCKSIEQVFVDFIKSTKATHLFPAMKHPQRKFVHEVAQKFRLRSESLDDEPFRSVLVARKPESTSPKPSLAEAWSQQYKPSHVSNPAAKKELVTQAPQMVSAPPKQEVNALYLKACFGYDEQSLKKALSPYMPGTRCELRWISDEDVVCIPQLSLSPTELTSKLRLIRDTIRNKLASCQAVDTAYFDTTTECITHKERRWSSVPVSSAGGSSVWTQGPSLTLAGNSFAALSVPNKQPPGRSRPASPIPARSSRDVDIVANGFHRPPSAVVVNGHVDLADDWEDSL